MEGLWSAAMWGTPVGLGIFFSLGGIGAYFFFSGISKLRVNKD